MNRRRYGNETASLSCTLLEAIIGRSSQRGAMLRFASAMGLCLLWLSGVLPPDVWASAAAQRPTTDRPQQRRGAPVAKGAASETVTGKSAIEFDNVIEKSRIGFA